MGQDDHRNQTRSLMSELKDNQMKVVGGERALGPHKRDKDGVWMDRLLVLLEKCGTKWPASITVGFGEGNWRDCDFLAARLGLLSVFLPAPFRGWGWATRMLVVIWACIFPPPVQGIPEKSVQPNPK